MPRALRIEYPGAIYHALSRGDRREKIFNDDHDRQIFVATLQQTCGKTAWQIHAWCLMTNHFHLVIETPRPNLSAGMKWFLGTYTQRYNLRHRLTGHLFAGRFKALLVDGRAGEYLRTVCDYVHLNPARAGVIAAEAPLEAYPWSSYRDYLRPPGTRPGWLRVDRLMNEHGVARDTRAGRHEFACASESVRGSGLPENVVRRIRRGWKFGAQDFVEWLVDTSVVQPREGHGRSEREETETENAERIVRAELHRVGWTEADLGRKRKGDLVKVRIATRLRKETAVTLKWIAHRLHMGTWTHVTNRLYHAGWRPGCVNT